LLAIIRGWDIADENCSANGEHPHEQRGPGKNHGKGSHCGNPTKIPLRIILLGVARANEDALDVSSSTFLHQWSPDVLPNVVPHQVERNPVSTAEIHKRCSDLSARSERENITPMRNHIKVSLSIFELGISWFKSIREQDFPRSSMVKISNLALTDSWRFAFNPTTRGKERFGTRNPRSNLRSWSGETIA
jgi:hypothetical protein